MDIETFLEALAGITTCHWVMRLSFKRWFQRSSSNPAGGAKEGRAWTRAVLVSKERVAGTRVAFGKTGGGWILSCCYRFLLTWVNFCWYLFQAQDTPKRVMLGLTIFSRVNPLVRCLCLEIPASPAWTPHSEEPGKTHCLRSQARVHVSHWCERMDQCSLPTWILFSKWTWSRPFPPLEWLSWSPSHHHHHHHHHPLSWCLYLCGVSVGCVIQSF